MLVMSGVASRPLALGNYPGGVYVVTVSGQNGPTAVRVAIP
jgi:flavin reductase (DIM6/NTAB) family NADH-FMN oxidoreductase RutF